MAATELEPWSVPSLGQTRRRHCQGHASPLLELPITLGGGVSEFLVATNKQEFLTLDYLRCPRTVLSCSPIVVKYVKPSSRVSS